MRVLIVGAGGMGRAWARNILSNDKLELAAWVDLRPCAAAESARDVGAEPRYLGTDLVQAIDAVAPDFVVDVTSPEGHHGVTLTALSCGLPVLGEKPMAASMEQAREMVAASEKAGKLYMVSQSRRYDDGLVAYRKLIQERLGGLGILNADFYIGAHFGGFREEMDSVLLLDMAIHTFDEARFLCGKDPVAVYAEEFNPSWSWFKGDASANVIFEMEGGLRFAYRGSWCGEGCHTSWDGDWRAVGPNGTAIWAHNETPYAELVSRPEGLPVVTERVSEPKPQIATGINGSLKEFLHALETGETPNGECHDNIKSLAMVFAAIESAKRRERIAIHF